MKHVEGNFRGYHKFNIYYQSWLPDRKPKAILVVAHGMAEHSGRYVNLANYFVSKGYAVYGLDHRGHGKSEGLRCDVEHFSDYLNDLDTFFDLIRSEQGDARLFLIGHSMGGTMATAYAIHHQHELGGLILSGAGLKVPADISPVLLKLVPIAARLLPKMGIMAFDPATACRDQDIIEAAKNDPLLYHGKIRVRLGAEMFRQIQELPRQMSWLNLPMLIMHGTADRLADPAGSQLLFERASSKDKTLKLYEDCYHEVFNDPGHEQVFADMEAWLDSRVRKTKK